MKKILVVLLIFSISFWSCNNDEEQVDNENVENQVTEDVQIEDITETNDKQEQKDSQEPKLDTDFKEFVNQFKTVDLPYELDPQQDDVFGKISVENQVKYLAKAEDLEKADFEEMAEYTDFFFVSRPVRSFPSILILFI